MSDASDLLTTEQAAVILGYAPATLGGWRLRGTGPAFVRMGSSRFIRYRMADLEKWIDQNVVHPTPKR